MPDSINLRTDRAPGEYIESRDVNQIAQAVNHLASRSGISVTGSVATFGNLPQPSTPGKAFIVRDEVALYVSDETGGYHGPFSVEGEATDAAVADKLKNGTATTAALAVREPFIYARTTADFTGGTGTDNYAAIQSAIDAAPPGGTVVIGARGRGTMFCSQPLRVDKPIRLTSEGVVGHLDYANRLIFPAGVRGIDISINRQTGRPSNFQIDNLWLHSLSTSEAPSGAGEGIFWTDGRGRIENVVIENFGGHGIYARAGAAVGGGNITKSTITRPRIYGAYKDGIRFFGTDVQHVLVEQPDIVACHGWGINIEQANFNQVTFPHFDQRFNGSPGIIRDCAIGNDYGYIYAENGANGTTVLLDKLTDRESGGAKFEYGPYAGNLVFIDNTSAKSAVIFDRSKRAIRRDLSILSVDGQHQYRLDSGVGNINGLTLTYVPGAGSSLTQKTVATYSRGTDQLFIGTRLSPVGPQSIGAGSSRWVNAFFSSFVSLGTTTTTSRPPHSSVTAGAMLYDTDLKKPIFYDGAVWRDAGGTQV